MKKQAVSDGLDLTGINDVEIAGYLRDEKEIELRKIMWELLQRDYSKRKRAQQEKKKDGPAKKALKTGGVEDDERKSNKKKTMSSKINYDALKKLEEEISTIPEIEKDSHYNADGDLAVGDQYSEMPNHDYEDDDFDYEMTY